MLLRTIIQSASVRAGFFVQKSSGTAEAHNVIASMRPIKTDLNLVRIGSDLDGGYLIPESAIRRCDAVFSPGVADVADFERFFLDMGIPCYLIDGSVDSAPVDHPKAFFSKLWLSGRTVDGVSISLQDWVRTEAKVSSDLILQMDIEGAEYECLLSTPKAVLERFMCLVIEFHDLHSALLRSGSVLVSATLAHLQETHSIVHFHVNNSGPLIKVADKWLPDIVEVTFVRNDLIQRKEGFAALPNPLDRPNDPTKRDRSYEF